MSEAKTHGTYSTTQLYPTTPLSLFGTSLSTTRSAALIKRLIWSTTPCLAKGRPCYTDVKSSRCRFHGACAFWPLTCSVFTKPSASSRVATVYVNNGSLGSFKSQLSMNVFTVSTSAFLKSGQWWRKYKREIPSPFSICDILYKGQMCWFVQCTT